MATVLLAPWVLRDARRGVLPRGGKQISLVLVSGVFLAGHFLLWTESLKYTSVAASVLLVSLHPIIVTPLGKRLLGERVSRQMLAGGALAIAGTIVTCAGDFRVDSGAFGGDLLAIAGGLCLAGYLLIGRERSRESRRRRVLRSRLRGGVRDRCVDGGGRRRRAPPLAKSCACVLRARASCARSVATPCTTGHSVMSRCSSSPSRSSESRRSPQCLPCSSSRRCRPSPRCSGAC